MNSSHYDDLHALDISFNERITRSAEDINDKIAENNKAVQDLINKVNSSQTSILSDILDKVTSSLKLQSATKILNQQSDDIAALTYQLSQLQTTFKNLKVNNNSIKITKCDSIHIQYLNTILLIIIITFQAFYFSCKSSTQPKSKKFKSKFVTTPPSLEPIYYRTATQLVDDYPKQNRHQTSYESYDDIQSCDFISTNRKQNNSNEVTKTVQADVEHHGFSNDIYGTITASSEDLYSEVISPKIVESRQDVNDGSDIYAVELKNVNNIFNKTITKIEENLQTIEDKLNKSQDNLRILQNSTKLEVNASIKQLQQEINQSKNTIARIEDKIKVHEVNSANFNIFMNNILNQINRINTNAINQKLELTQLIKKSSDEIKAGSKIEFKNTEEICSQKIVDHGKNITKLMKNELNNTQISFTNKLQLMLNSFNDKILEIKKDNEAFAGSYSKTAAKLTTLTTQSTDLIKNVTKIENHLSQMELKLEQAATNQMPEYVKILIIFNIILIVLLIVTISFLIYNLKFKSISNTYNKIQRNNSSCHQFNTISTQAALYDQFNEPVYASTNLNDEPIYEEYGNHSLQLYEAAGDSASRTHPSNINNDFAYESYHQQADKSHNEIENDQIYESGDESIYEVAEQLGTAKAESVAAVVESDEDLYSQIPMKMNDEGEKAEESEIYAVVRKS
ncbi:unnamed protein product [Chironomus riparius]|uniref:Uncharacterized protein n=1 Tax=Chironomus riparius TaxID=315576 RepID=A0A9N9S4I4_9DIPT|nr:unnamed protein product [Chironomus riparius]